MSSTNSGYEAFAPMKFMDIKFKNIINFPVWTFEVSLDFSTIARARILFTDESGVMEYSSWKMAGKAEFRQKDRSILRTENFYCTGQNPYHEFDGSELYHEGDSDGSITIFFKELVGFEINPRPWDLFHPSAETDVCLVAQGTKFYQNKKILAYLSPYFKRLFFGDFREKNQKEVEIGDILPRVLSYLFDAMHGALCVHSGNVEETLMCGDRFDAPIVTARAERYLLIDSVMGKFQKLHMADKYGLPRLQAALFSSWSDDDVTETLKGTNPFLKKLSDKAQASLLTLRTVWKKRKTEE